MYERNKPYRPTPRKRTRPSAQKDAASSKASASTRSQNASSGVRRPAQTESAVHGEDRQAQASSALRTESSAIQAINVPRIEEGSSPTATARIGESRPASNNSGPAGATQPAQGRSGGKLNGKLAILGALAALALVGVFAFAFGSGMAGSDNAQTSQSPAAASNASAPSSDAAAGNATEPYSISFVSTGDFIIWNNEAQYIDENGGASATAKVADYLASADVTITNVESPLSDNASEPIMAKDVYILGRPAAIESIEACGVDLASLANNHIMDYSGPALKDTIDALDSIGVKHAGAGMTEEEASQIAELEVDGVSIAFLSWTDIVPEYFVAYGDEPGVVSARLNMEDACKRVREAKQTHDIVIVAMHWGIEYEHYTTPSLQDDPAHQLVDAGADVILGNHPHVVQGLEFYKDALIAYAHGNFVFYQIYDDCHESYLLNFDMTNEGVKNVVLTPLHLDDYWGIPDFATGDVAQATLERLEEISSDMNTKFEIRDGKAYVTAASDAPATETAATGTATSDAATSDATAASAGATAAGADPAATDASVPAADAADAPAPGTPDSAATDAALPESDSLA